MFYSSTYLPTWNLEIVLHLPNRLENLDDTDDPERSLICYMFQKMMSIIFALIFRKGMSQNKSLSASTESQKSKGKEVFDDKEHKVKLQFFYIYTILILLGVLKVGCEK